MKIIVAGDFCPKDRMKDLIDKSLFYDSFKQVKLKTEEVDYSIINLECPIVMTNVEPIEKCGPNLKGSPKTIEAIKWMGFNCVTLANNHFFDYGTTGIDNTLDVLLENKIDYVGGGKNLLEASRILYVNINEKKLAIINCCEREFSIATETSGGANPLNVIRQYYSVLEASKSADYVIVIVHGGYEHFQLPSLRMKETYRFFVDIGADAVINHHQHCFSGYEVYKGKPIFYGIGNFCFDWNGKRNSPWNEGYMVELHFGKEVKFLIHPYIQCDANIEVNFTINLEEFEKRLHELNNIIADNSVLKKVCNKYLDDQSKNYIFCFEPFYNRITSKLYWKKWFPSFIKKRRQALLNYIGNESHYDKVMRAIEITKRNKK